MNFTIQLSESELTSFTNRVNGEFREVQDPVQAAMAARYGEIVRSNFGETGIDRPGPWPMLSPAYAKKVGRSYATLYVSGALYDAVKVDTQAANVSVSNSSVPYALVHAYGGSRMPQRQYFPMHEDGTPTDFTVQEMEKTVSETLQRIL